MSFSNPRQTQPPPAFRDHPGKLFVELTSHCNLGCAMCVKQAPGGRIQEGEMSAETFSALLPAMKQLEALVLNGIGESLLHPRIDEFIRLARRQMPEHGWIGFQSNGLLLDEARARSLAAAGIDRICLSVDASSPEAFRTLRQGGELQAVERAFAALRAARTERPGLAIGIEFVLMRQNLHLLCDTLRWAAARGASFALVSHLLPYDESSRGESLYPDCTEAALELFDRWRQRGKAQGIDIERYHRVAFKFSRSVDEQRVVDLVEGMKAEAEEKGVFFDLKKLLQIDRALLDRVAAIFRKAERLAAELGLDLELPEIIPRALRRCDFIEDGSAFISWDGKVHPCYFLWHSYRCHASGWEQQVQARSFGRVGEQNLLQIWNSAEFRAFRHSVLDYDHPFCYACTLAPCDYIQTDNFEHDCHLRTEPCGSCLWCMGLFRCLR
ncbi:putative metalloenzyme radical SAM/SPASM domain maturase [Geothermobacter ehrlichii]|uniref:Putative metalloenzyme radical SAM/SPASM domain maturase n=1 Tax=Geothermobacter ehrlichii TaxID=213224 RepID=A0A5D3WLV7_9BACT|nr:radical SAM/SPASM family putative metalloenzyme maturase [Geothermobacter ehrlichii]TYO99173.1 putative metalloenzyme radical SAM/SPASM domain maturase [Geothermobacter ehrlichii]